MNNKKVLTGLIVLFTTLLIGFLFFEYQDTKLISNAQENQEKALTLQHKNENKSGDRRKPEFKTNEIMPLTLEDIEKVDVEKQISTYGIGILKIQSIELELPVLEGLTQENLSVGVGTMKKNQTPETSNYTLIGHHLPNGLLLGKLGNVEIGSIAELQISGTNYRYKIVENKIIPETDLYVTDDGEGKGIITILTCDKPTETEKRIMVRGQLIQE